MFGPSLPPGLDKNTKGTKKVIGPQLPNPVASSESVTYEPEEPLKSEQLPIPISQRDSGLNEPEEYGPVPLPEGLELEYEKLERKRKLEMINYRQAPTKPTTTVKEVREDWMLRPPEPNRVGSIPDLKSRTFQRKTVDGSIDHKLWTATPDERDRMEESNKKLKLDAQKPRSQKEQAYHEFVENHNKLNRPKSLMEQHQRNAKKRPADPEQERFNRERDIVGFKSVSSHGTRKDSEHFASKFSHGESSSFL